MAYQTGTATSPIDLLQKLVTWLQGLGWTINMSQAEGTGWRAHLLKGSIYVNLRAAVNERISGDVYNNTLGTGIAVNISTGYSAAASWREQPGGPVYAGGAIGYSSSMKLPVSNITAYHLFSDASDNINVIVESSPTVFCYIGWGTLIKIGGWTGGAYCFGDHGTWNQFCNTLTEGWTVPAACPFMNGDFGGYACAWIKADIDTYTGKWLALSPDTTYYRGATSLTKFARSPLYTNSTVHHIPTGQIPAYAHSSNFIYSFQVRQFSQFNSQVMFLPIHIYVDRDAGGCSLLGRVPNIYACQATDHGIPAASILQIGSDNYMVFPNFAVKKT
jgi:hypothetical protein